MLCGILIPRGWRPDAVVGGQVELPFSRNVMVVGQGLKPNSCTGHKVRACVPFGGDITRRAAPRSHWGCFVIRSTHCHAGQLCRLATANQCTQTAADKPFKERGVANPKDLFNVQHLSHFQLALSIPTNNNPIFLSKPSTIPGLVHKPKDTVPSLALSTHPKGPVPSEE